LELGEKPPKFNVEPLGSDHNRAAFCCEKPALQTYLRTQARQDMEKNLAAVFVMTADGKTIAGYYTLSQYSIQSGEIPEEISRKLTRHQEIPATLIGRLARDISVRGTGIGDLLLSDALRRCVSNSKQAASWAVVVDVKDDDAATFYKKWEFQAFPSQPMKMFLPTSTAEKLFA
jgi:predicted N-acetyltransferase YhbS